MIMQAMPIGMMCSVVLTVGYKASYESRDLAVEVPTAETVVIPEIFFEKFLLDSAFIFNLEEYSPLPDNVAEYITDYKGYCPYIINSMHIDERCSVRVLLGTPFEELSQFPSYQQ